MSTNAKYCHSKWFFIIHIFFSVLVLESVFRFPEVANCKWFALEFREAKTSIKSEKLIFKNDYERVEKKIVNEFAPLT